VQKEIAQWSKDQLQKARDQFDEEVEVWF